MSRYVHVPVCTPPGMYTTRVHHTSVHHSARRRVPLDDGEVYRTMPWGSVRQEASRGLQVSRSSSLSHGGRTSLTPGGIMLPGYRIPGIG